MDIVEKKFALLSSPWTKECWWSTLDTRRPARTRSLAPAKHEWRGSTLAGAACLIRPARPLISSTKTRAPRGTVLPLADRPGDRRKALGKTPPEAPQRTMKRGRPVARLSRQHNPIFF